MELNLEKGAGIYTYNEVETEMVEKTDYTILFSGFKGQDDVKFEKKTKKDKRISAKGEHKEVKVAAAEFYKNKEWEELMKYINLFEKSGCYRK